MERITSLRTDSFHLLQKKKFHFFFRLSEKETLTSVNIFSDHTGVIIDPYGLGLSSMNRSGIRLSPRQSPVYQPMVRLMI